MTSRIPAGEADQLSELRSFVGRRAAKRLVSNPRRALPGDSQQIQGRAASVGLREEKKERVREQLLEAAMRLFNERGYEQTTIDDIVQMTGVSRRTFFRYFETKEDVAIAWNLDDDFEGLDVQFAEALATHMPGAGPLDAFREFSLESLCLRGRTPDFVKMQLKVEQLIAKTPALRARRKMQTAQFAENVAVELAKRWNVDPQRDLRPRVVANCAMAIVMTALDAWTECGEGRAELMEQAFRTFEMQFGPSDDSVRARDSSRTSSKVGRGAKQQR